MWSGGLCVGECKTERAFNQNRQDTNETKEKGERQRKTMKKKKSEKDGGITGTPCDVVGPYRQNETDSNIIGTLAHPFQLVSFSLEKLRLLIKTKQCEMFLKTYIQSDLHCVLHACSHKSLLVTSPFRLFFRN